MTTPAPAKARKPKTPTDAASAAARAVLFACSDDACRNHMATPFRCEWSGSVWVAATDGHRVAMVRATAGEADGLRSDGPPLDRVLNTAAPTTRYVGVLSASGLDDARVFPKSWDVALQFKTPLDRAVLDVSVLKGSGKTERRLRPFGKDTPIDWAAGCYLEALTFPLRCSVHYLLDAVDFVGTEPITVYASGELDPVFLTNGNEPTTAPRVAVVMPCRA